METEERIRVAAGGILVEKTKQTKIKDEKKIWNYFYDLLNTGATFLHDMLVAAQRHQLLQVSALLFKTNRSCGMQN